MNNKHVGSDFEMFLEDEGILQEVTEIARSRVIKLSQENEKLLKRSASPAQVTFKTPTQK